MKRLLKYLKGTTKYSLCYQGNDLRLKDYTDVDWRRDLDEMKSTLGFILLLNSGAISWSSKKQYCIALLTMEAEFVALSIALQEGVWLRIFLEHLINKVDTIEPVLVNCDSPTTIAYTKDPKFHAKTKHKDIKYNFMKDMVARKEVKMKYICKTRVNLNFSKKWQNRKLSLQYKLQT